MAVSTDRRALSDQEVQALLGIQAIPNPTRQPNGFATSVDEPLRRKEIEKKPTVPENGIGTVGIAFPPFQMHSETYAASEMLPEGIQAVVPFEAQGAVFQARIIVQEHPMFSVPRGERYVWAEVPNDEKTKTLTLTFRNSKGDVATAHPEVDQFNQDKLLYRLFTRAGAERQVPFSEVVGNEQFLEATFQSKLQ